MSKVTDSRLSYWLAYWIEEGIDMTTLRGQIHARDQVAFPTEENSYLNIDSFVRSLGEAELSNLCFLVEDKLSESYCPCCELYLEPAVLLEGEDQDTGETERICSDCNYIEFIERTHYA